MTRLLALVLVFLRRCLWLGAIGLMLLALYVSLGRQLVPLVAEYRLEVQEKAQELLNTPVALGSLEGRWEGFSPRLLAHDVLIGEGDRAMRLDRLTLVPDLSASIMSRQLQVQTVEFTGAHLSLVEGADGRWRIDGLPERSDQSPADPQKFFAELQKIDRLLLLDSQITLEAHAEAPLTLTYADFELSATGERLRLDGRVLLPGGQPLSMRAQAHVGMKDWRDGDAQLYLRLPQSDWAAWLPTSLTGSWSVTQLQVGGEIWLDWRERGLARAVARLNAPVLQAGRLQRDPVQVDDLAVNAYLSRSSDGYRLQVDGLAFTYDDNRWRDTAVIVQQNSPKDRWRLQVDRIPVAPAAKLIQALAPLPDLASEYLLGLAPSGTLRNLQFDYQPTAAHDERLSFAGNLDAVSIAARNWIPAIRNVSGEVRGNLGGGELRFDNRDFSLHLAELFPNPWDYRRSRGRFLWSVSDQAFTLAAPYLQVDGEEGRIAGDFLIRLMRDPASEDYMDLRVGIRDGDARFTKKYLPTRSPALSPALGAWLNEAIRDGTVEQGYFQYQGALNKDAADTARNLSLYFKVKDAELAFQPGWPVLREGRGEVLIEDSGVRVRLADARMLDSRVHDTTADIPRSPGGQAPRLNIEGQVNGNLRDALTLMQVAPIGTADLFAGWRADGPLSGTLNLEIPLAKGGQPKVAVAFTSSVASLFIAQADLQLEALGGEFRYDSDHGFSASEFHGQTLGSPIRGKAIATGQPDSPATRIEASGTVALQQLLAWRKIEQPVPASGQVPFRMNLVLDGADNHLQLDSSLLGTALALPAPFGKTAEERRDTTLRMTLGGERQRYAFRHDTLAALTYVVPAGKWTEGGGELVLGGAAANLRTDQGLFVRGNLPRLDLSEWQALLDEYGETSGNRAASSLLRRVQLDIGVFDGFGTRIDNLGVDLQPLAEGWSLGLDSRTVTGTARLPGNGGEPIVLELSRLELPAAEPSKPQNKPTDPLAAFDPKSLPAMDIAIAEVLQGDQRMGAWSLKMRPVEDGVEFSELNLDLKGLKLGGNAGWTDSHTWYKGKLEGDNVGDVLLAWGFAPSTTSESFQLDVDGSWPGSPAYFNLQRLTGRLSGRLRNGQLREVDGSAQALRVFGLLNFASIGRRLRLDFSDLFSKGLSYDSIKGELVATDGIYVTSQPLTVAGPSSDLELDGRLDMVNDQIDAKLLVTLPVSNNLPLAALIVGAPAIGGALFVVDKLLGDRVARFASVQYNVEGSWRAPKITFDKPFEKPN